MKATKHSVKACELCGRDDVDLTFHHLIPRKMQDKKYVLKHFEGIDPTTYGIMVCAACHKNIHKKISHRDLALTYNSLEALKSHEELMKFVNFNAKQRKKKKG